MDAQVGYLCSADHRDPVVVVGSGPVGFRAVQEILRVAPQTRVVWYGDEPWQPYNRIKLSSFLAGELSWAALAESAVIPAGVDCRFGLRVTAIDRDRALVKDALGVLQPYSSLVLATGSRAHRPNIAGVDLPGVFVFRDIQDAQRLQARTVRSRTTVVIGGGLLGLEAARAVRRFHTHVWVIEHADRLMPKQLDAAAAEVLGEQVAAMGLQVRLAEGVREILGPDSVSGVMLRDGTCIGCDTVIVATGIQPNIELAAGAGLPVGRGVRVDQHMRSAEPNIYAVGECAEHRGVVHGLVAPGLEQASVAAHAIAGVAAEYHGSIAATNLKVMGCKVFSIGDAERHGPADIATEIRWRRAGMYRKLLFRQGRLAGAIGIGDWPECSRIQEAVRGNRFAWPWQRRRFQRLGRLWPEREDAAVALWPADATVCNCTGITKGRLELALRGGCASVESLSSCTGAGTVCGSCRPLLAELAGGGRLPALPGAAALWLATLLLLALGLGYALFSLPFPDSADFAWRWDAIWRDKLLKQISGFSALAAIAALAAIGLRKRWPRLAAWDFDSWRLVHVALGAALLLLLAAHTGGRLGHRLDLAMSLALLAAVGSGALIAAVLARQQDLSPRAVRATQRSAHWAHVLSLWLLPVLLGFHVLKTYLF